MRASPSIPELVLALCSVACLHASAEMSDAPCDALQPYVVSVAHDATPPERWAASELISMLQRVACPPPAKASCQGPPLVSASSAHAKAQLAIGHTASKMAGLPESAVKALKGNESFLIRSLRSSSPPSVAITGGEAANRGTIYGTTRLLEELGFVFLAADETVVPRCPSHKGWSSNLNITATPTFEYRDCDASPNKNLTFDIRQHYNGASALAGRLFPNDTEHGGYVQYAGGFVHTSYSILGGAPHAPGGNGPPLDLFQTHNEWFWPHDDPLQYGQLCWSNSSLVDFVTERVKDALRATPAATIVSVSQNDNSNYCKDPGDMAVIQEDGSPIGPLLRAVNTIADRIKPEWPHVAVDTLAYTYTRPCPRVTRPRDNVIIRLCAMECNYAAPLSDPSNAEFQLDIVNWSKVSKRIFIWDYITSFANYIIPFPNWFVLGPNIKFFAEHNVKGVFEEGDEFHRGGDMEELKNFLIGKMLWDPTLDPEALIEQFLIGYFGEAAVHVRRYMDLMHGSAVAVSYFMHEGIPPDASFLTTDVVLAAATAFKIAESVVATNPIQLARVKKARLSTDFVVLERWDEMRAAAAQKNVSWPLPQSQKQAFAEFAARCAQEGVTQIRESGCTSVIPCMQEEITLAPYPPVPAPRLPTAQPWTLKKCDVELDAAGLGQCRCSNTVGVPSLLSLSSNSAQDRTDVSGTATELTVPVAVYSCPPCCDHGFEVSGIWDQCVSTGCTLRSHGGRCLTSSVDGIQLSFAPCVSHNSSMMRTQMFTYEEHTGALRSVASTSKSNCVVLSADVAGATVILGPCESHSSWAWDGASAPQDSAFSLRWVNSSDTLNPASNALASMCLREAAPVVESLPLHVHDCIYEDPALLFSLLPTGQLTWRQDPTLCLTVVLTTDHPLGELRLQGCLPETIAQQFHYLQSTNQWHPRGRSDLCLTSAGGTEGRRRRLQTQPAAVVDTCNSTSTIWQVKPGLHGAAANLVCFSGECTQPACLGANPNLGGSHAGVQVSALGPPAVVARASESFLLFPGWATLFPNTNHSLLHVTTCSDALHDIGWTGRHFVSSGNSTGPESWREPQQTAEDQSVSGSWRHATSCVPVASAEPGVSQLRCMGYDLHCKPEDSPCTASTVAYVNTTCFTLNKSIEHVEATNGGLMTFTFPLPLVTNRQLRNCTDVTPNCPAYTYAAYPGNGQIGRLRTGGFLQLVGATVHSGPGKTRNGMFAMRSDSGSAWHTVAELREGSCPGLGENDWTYQSDNVTVFAVFRNNGPAATLCATRSATEGRTWSVATVLKLLRPSNVLPRVVCLTNGLLALSSGRIGLFLDVSSDNGTTWHSIDVALSHNVMSAAIGDRFSEAFIRGAGDSAMSSSYTSLVHYDGTDVVQVCYDRLGNGWNPSPGSYGNTSAVFCSKLQVAAPR